MRKKKIKKKQETTKSSENTESTYTGNKKNRCRI